MSRAFYYILQKKKKKGTCSFCSGKLINFYNDWPLKFSRTTYITNY
ncbi:Hypothetical protein MCYN_0505 [Mycoplasmopsis cynos C142]|uniref:Uncharacterized protein n=1 Tax=Mycoplasmopsis cynos (strain C142) TaxID=1246955 RepID=L0RVS9_MYCC1|nr:Hypothetical protein MCYN_0505 [Mycoplasmopsis cynos C142]